MKNALVIVESPAKAKKIAEFLGAGYTVESSVGHIRDLPAKKGELPEAYKKGPYARFNGVNVEDGFKALYVVSEDRKKTIRRLRQLLAQSDELYLATDEDREGEAIAWHLKEELSPQIPVKRMVFHEITRAAIAAAVASPRELDLKMVDAQEARRILDRLYGYEVSPVLWEKVQPKLSAGRVQSVATRIVVERERQRIGFVAAGYWSLKGIFQAADKASKPFSAKLYAVDDKRVAVGKDFAEDGQLKRSDVVVLTEEVARELAVELEVADHKVRSCEAKPYRRRPAPPFITSTYQQEAGRKLKMSAQLAMRVAQGLYEKGYITYMRTDSTTLSATALQAARTTIQSRFGKEFLPPKPRFYAKKSASAQEAHEAIRPAGEVFRAPEEVGREVSPAELRVYELIWKRTIASQMNDCVGETLQLRFGAKTASKRDATFSASGTAISHMGFREVYEETSDKQVDPAEADEDKERILPRLKEGNPVLVEDPPLIVNGHETNPPPRYTEASLVKRLEELGVGRPSTYASIIGTIIDRGYVWKKEAALVPSFTAFSVVNLMEKHFPNLVDYHFSAQMEGDLDKIANGSEEAKPWLTRFYFGGGEGSEPGLREKVETRHANIDAKAINTFPLGVDEDGKPIVVRLGRKGAYVKRGDGEINSDIARGNTAFLPDDLPPDELTLAKAEEFLAQPKDERNLGTDPKSGEEVIAKAGRFGPYVRVGSGSGSGSGSSGGGSEVRFASLFESMSLETVTLDEALKLLSLPRKVGEDPADGVAITAQNGRFGPYITKGKENRSLENEDQIFSVTLQECLELLSKPKMPRGRVAKPPLRELGADPESGKPMIVKEGRFGTYVTDGEFNATLRTGDTAENITPERAAELLAERRIRGPAKPSGGRRTAARKAPAKRASAKRAPAKRSAAKRAPSRRSPAKRAPAKRSPAKPSKNTT